jgi:hypothetical protein
MGRSEDTAPRRTQLDDLRLNCALNHESATRANGGVATLPKSSPWALYDWSVTFFPTTASLGLDVFAERDMRERNPP